MNKSTVISSVIISVIILALIGFTKDYSLATVIGFTTEKYSEIGKNV